MDSFSIVWVVLSGLGSMIIAIILSIAGYFLARYIRQKDEKDKEGYDLIIRLAQNVSEINLNIKNQNLLCDTKMASITKDVTGLVEVTKDHEGRIKKIEHKVL